MPFWPDDNPYQKCLLRNLQRLGAKAEGQRATFIIFPILFAVFSHWKPQITHLHWLDPFLFFKNNWILSSIKSITFGLELLILRAMNIRIVWTVHNLKSHENRFPKLETFFTSKIAHLADAIIVHCERAKPAIQDAFAVKSRDKFTAIKHGNYINFYKNMVPRTAARKKLGLASTEYTFLHLGLIRSYKGVIKLIDTFKELDAADTNLLIAGKPANGLIAEEIRNRIRGISSIRAMLDFVPDDEIQIYMNAADVVVFPYQEVLTSGGVILAMSFGKPIIAPRLGCIPDMLDSTGSFLYDPSTHAGLLLAMKNAVDSKLKVREMGGHNFDLAKNLTWRQIAVSTLSVYRKCLAV